MNGQHEGHTRKNRGDSLGFAILNFFMVIAGGYVTFLWIKDIIHTKSLLHFWFG